MFTGFPLGVRSFKAAMRDTLRLSPLAVLFSFYAQEKKPAKIKHCEITQVYVSEFLKPVDGTPICCLRYNTWLSKWGHKPLIESLGNYPSSQNTVSFRAILYYLLRRIVDVAFSLCRFY